VQAREELGEDEEQEVDEEEVEVEGREGAEHERRPHFIASFRADTKAAQADEAMRSSLRAEHLLQQRHTGAPAAAARIAHLLPWQIVIVLERRRQEWRSRSSLAFALAIDGHGDHPQWRTQNGDMACGVGKETQSL
jgi:hypothetical protein